MKKTVVSALALAIVIAIGIGALSDARAARPSCIVKKVDTGCCIAVGWVWAQFCCVAKDGTQTDCYWEVIRDKKVCVPGVPLC